MTKIDWDRDDFVRFAPLVIVFGVGQWGDCLRVNAGDDEWPEHMWG